MTRPLLPRLLVALLAAGLAAPALAAKNDFPKLKQGEWEFTRKMANAPKHVQDLAVKECLDPVRAMKEQNAMLEKAGCVFETPKVEGNVYTYVAQCDIPNVGKSTSRSTLTRESDTAYTVLVEGEGTVNGKPMKTSETLVAKRVGSCAKK